MNPVLQDFIRDLDRLRRLFALADKQVSFSSMNVSDQTISDPDLLQSLTAIQEVSRNTHVDMPILNGVLLLYLAGRFENFVRELFEDLCDSLAEDCSEFLHLPKQMRQNLVTRTAEVISNPRKYGHAEAGVAAFISTLSDNLSGKPLTAVNSKCLSITTENMWPDTLNELFSRIGANKIWERLGQQAGIQTLFHVDQPDRATSEARKLLSTFMELRNRIAHPSGELEWPSIENATEYINFCEAMARSLADICNVWSGTLGERLPEQEEAKQVAEGVTTTQ